MGAFSPTLSLTYVHAVGTLGVLCGWAGWFARSGASAGWEAERRGSIWPAEPHSVTCRLAFGGSFGCTMIVFSRSHSARPGLPPRGFRTYFLRV